MRTRRRWRETCAEFVAKYAEEMWEYPRENVRDRDADGAAAAEDRDGGQVHGGDEPPNGTDGAAPATEDVNGPDFVKPGKKNARGKKKAGDEMVDYDGKSSAILAHAPSVFFLLHSPVAYLLPHLSSSTTLS